MPAMSMSMIWRPVNGSVFVEIGVGVPEDGVTVPGRGAVDGVVRGVVEGVVDVGPLCPVTVPVGVVVVGVVGVVGVVLDPEMPPSVPGPTPP